MSDSPLLASGFGRVTRQLTSRLQPHPGLDVACLGWGHPSSASDPHAFPVPVYPSDSRSFGRDALEAVVDEFRPDVLITLGELRMIDWLASHPIRDRFRWIAYVPIDGGPFYPPWRQVLDRMDRVVAMSSFGRCVLSAGVPGDRLRMIHHGVDTSVFHRLETRGELKQHPRFAGRFVVGCVARNQARKNLPALVQAFSLLAEKYADLHLYLHSTFAPGGADLVELLRRFHLQGRADLSTPWISLERAWSDEELNELYNLFDVLVLPTCGEGFGLPILESLSAGTPVVATDFSACPELVRGHGELARVQATVITGENLLEQAIVDVEDLARCIGKLYCSPELIAQYGRRGVDFAATLSWDRLLPEWLKLLTEVSGIELSPDG